MTVQDILTLIAIVVALGLGVFGPYIVERWRRRFQRSNLTIVSNNGIITDQQNFDPDSFPTPGQVLRVVRLAIRNGGNYKASSVEAYLEKIEWDGETRKDFIPMPLLWTHMQSVRDIYPQQTVYLDLIYIVANPHMVGEQEIYFAVAVGRDIDNLAKLNPYNESKLLIKLYQESGELNKISASVYCENLDVKSVTVNQLQ